MMLVNRMSIYRRLHIYSPKCIFTLLILFVSFNFLLSQVHVTQNGDVGIGIQTPKSPFEVNGYMEVHPFTNSYSTRYIFLGDYNNSNPRGEGTPNQGLNILTNSAGTNSKIQHFSVNGRLVFSIGNLDQTIWEMRGRNYSLLPGLIRFSSGTPSQDKQVGGVEITAASARPDAQNFQDGGDVVLQGGQNAVTSVGGRRGFVLLNKDGGNVGIGTDDPSGKLEISSSLASPNEMIRLTKPAWGSQSIYRYDTGYPLNYSGIFFANSLDETPILSIESQYHQRVGIGTHLPETDLDIFQSESFGASKGLRLSYNSTNFSNLKTNSDGDLLVRTSSGNMGFGSEDIHPSDMDPDTPLHLYVEHGIGTKDLFEMEIAGGYGANVIRQWYENSNDLGLHIGNGYNDDNYFTINNGTGNIGIGTESPLYRLDVNGGVRVENRTGTGTVIAGFDINGKVVELTLGDGLILVNGELSVDPSNNMNGGQSNIIQEQQREIEVLRKERLEQERLINDLLSRVEALEKSKTDIQIQNK